MIVKSICSIFFLLFVFQVQACKDCSDDVFHVGLIVNLNSVRGNVKHTCIKMAISNFEHMNPTHSPKIKLHVMDSNGDVLKAADGVLDLIKNVGVQVIIGPETSEEADFLAYIGNKAQIPIISFSATGSSLSPTQFPYFIRGSQKMQFKAIAAITQAYRWKELSIVHEDTQSGVAAVPVLTDTLHENGVIVCHRTILPDNANEQVIKKSLQKLRGMSSKVFIVHLSSSLATKFFLSAHREGMMRTGYVWILTCTITDLMIYMDPPVLRSMNGVIGVKTHVPRSKALKKFILQWRRHLKQNHVQKKILQPDVYALKAYDTVFVLAMVGKEVVCRMNKTSPSPSRNGRTKRNATKFFDTTISPMCSNSFLQSVLTNPFIGLSGKFRSVKGLVEHSTFEIVNVIGNKDQIIGFWTPKVGLSRSLRSEDMAKNYSTTNNDLKVVTWPGGSTVTPKVLTLKVGVPVKSGFPEFINVLHYPDKTLNVSGYSKDVFEAVTEGFPYEYTYLPFETKDGISAGDYDNLTYHVYSKHFDVVVGDVTIVANRSQYVDFTQPYTFTGVQLVVPRAEDDFTTNFWWFTEPLTRGLWLATIGFFLFKGFLIWIFEKGNPEFGGSPSQQVGKVLSYSFSTLVFANKEKLESNYSRLIVNLWTFSVFILVTTYAANLTSMLTIKNLDQKTDINSLIRNREIVGYQSGSFVFRHLTQLGFHERNLQQLSTVDEYAEALKNRTVSAIMDELPYIQVLLGKYCGQFTTTGPTYPTGGFGFAFPKDSPLLSDVSKSVLEITEGGKMKDIQTRWFGTEVCDDGPRFKNTTSSKLRVHSFRSIFIILGVASGVLLILFFLSSIYKRAKDGSLTELVSWNSFRERISHMSMVCCFNKPPGDTEHTQGQIQREEEGMQESTEKSSAQRQGTDANEERQILTTGENSVPPEMTPSDDHPLEMTNIRPN